LHRRAIPEFEATGLLEVTVVALEALLLRQQPIFRWILEKPRGRVIQYADVARHAP
jgi:hypothetical protein